MTALAVNPLGPIGRSASRSRLAGVFISSALHVLFFLLGGSILSQPIQYGIESGSGVLEVSLLAGSVEPASVSEPVLTVQEIPVKNPTEQIFPVDSPPAQSTPAVAPSILSPSQGSGSLGAGARTEAKPNYLKNPAPIYPYEARQRGWQGLVMLKVSVSPQGLPLSVEVETGSGHSVLDQSAMKTVKKWKFQPALLGGISVESIARIPVRFELENGALR